MVYLSWDSGMQRGAKEVDGPKLQPPEGYQISPRRAPISELITLFSFYVNQIEPIPEGEAHGIALFQGGSHGYPARHCLGRCVSEFGNC